MVSTLSIYNSNEKIQLRQNRLYILIVLYCIVSLQENFSSWIDFIRFKLILSKNPILPDGNLR